MQAEDLLTQTLREHPYGAQLTTMMTAALNAVDPAEAVRRALQRNATQLKLGETVYDLAPVERVILVGAGKAGAPMLNAAAKIFADMPSVGLVVVKDGHTEPLARPELQLLEASHPLPDARGIAAATQIAELLATTTERDLVVALISGGGSALLTLPVAEVSLDDLQRLTKLLLGCGATINEINCLRKHLDQVKGGGLARMAAPAHLVALALSDVVGDPLDVIASGPTVPDPTTYQDALEILERYQIGDQVPASILTHLQRGAAGAYPETPKPGDPLFERVQTVIVGSNRQAAEAARQVAQAAGWQVTYNPVALVGEARLVGEQLALAARDLVAQRNPNDPPACWIWGGETTVTLHGTGRGGRNQELALAAVPGMAGLEQAVLITLATDGGDGPTDAAGAVVSGATLHRAEALALDHRDALARNDAYPFFAALDDLLRPGPTRTNVNDLTFLILT
jgi:hydroxypyruvate reductase